MEGILDMSQLLMELVAERLKQPPIPLILLELLASVSPSTVSLGVPSPPSLSIFPSSVCVCVP